jgi:hypothetical protein
MFLQSKRISKNYLKFFKLEFETKNTQKRSAIMKMKYFSFCAGIFIFFLFTSPHLHAQRFDSLLNVLDTKYPQERVYVQYDKSYYNPGETIWFKAYLFSGFLPSRISSTMYAELINDKGEMLERKVMPVVSSTASSGFDLPDSLKSSLVYVRVYTSWMLNFDSSFIYTKPIHIIVSTKTVKSKKTHSYLLDFFPEGGDMVAGLESRIAFKATDDEGLPIKIKGDIVDSKGQKVASFSDTHDGMGYFFLKPLPGEKYKAVWKDNNGKTVETVLPEAKPTGVLLRVDNKGSNLFYTLHRSPDAPANYKMLYVVAQMQQQPVYMARINLTANDSVTAPINVDSLPDGIMQVTIFAEDEHPVAERIVFVNQENYYFITDLHAEEKNFTKKGKNVLQIDVGDTLLTNLSISVTDAAVNPPDKAEENIFSHLLLTSDIKGYVYHPAYYFSDNSDSVRANLDLVMMTNGWRRFKWEDVVAGKWPVIKNYPQPFLTVKGNIFGLTPSQLAVSPELTLILSTKKSGGTFLSAPVDKKGEFTVPGLIFFDTARIFYQFSNDKDKTLTSTATIDFKNNLLPYRNDSLAGLNPFLKPVMPDTLVQKKNTTLTKLREQEFGEGIKVKELEVVKVTARAKSAAQKMDEEYTSGFFSGGDAHVFDVADDPFANTSISVLDYLRGKVAGLQINSNGFSGASVSWRGSPTSFFLNEVTTDVSMIQSVSMSDVAMIKVFNPPFFGAAGAGSGGAIAIYTKKGGELNNSTKGLDFVKISGYTPMKEFYSPDYSTDADVNKDDYRTTLYWNPNLVFDKTTRRIMVPFYNSDNCKKIRVVIEGINEEGKLTREEKFFE